jgi:hypothetical protein
VSTNQNQRGSKHLLWVVLAIVVVLAGCSDSGVSNGQADAISTTSSASTPPSSTASSASSTAAPTTAASTATTAATVTTVKVPTTKPPTPKPTTPPTLAVTSVKASVTTYPCSTSPQLTISWTTTLADSVTIGIDNPGAFQQNLPASGSLDVPFAQCPSGSVTYYIIAKKSNGDQITRTLTVNAGT